MDLIFVITYRQAILFVIVVHTLIICVHIEFRIRHLNLVDIWELRNTRADIDAGSGLSRRTWFGGDENDTVAGAGTVDCRRGCVLEHINRLDIADIEDSQWTHILTKVGKVRVLIRDRHTVNHIERFVTCTEWRYSSNDHTFTGSEVTWTSTYRYTGDTSTEQGSRAVHVTKFVVIHRHLADGTGDERATEWAITDYDYFLEKFCRCRQCKIDIAFFADLGLLVHETETSAFKRHRFGQCEGICAIHISRYTLFCTHYENHGARYRLSCRICNNTFHSEIPGGSCWNHCYIAIDFDVDLLGLENFLERFSDRSILDVNTHLGRKIKSFNLSDDRDSVLALDSVQCRLNGDIGHFQWDVLLLGRSHYTACHQETQQDS